MDLYLKAARVNHQSKKRKTCSNEKTFYFLLSKTAYLYNILLEKTLHFLFTETTPFFIYFFNDFFHMLKSCFALKQRN